MGWGADNPAYRQLFTNMYVPEASPKQMGWFNEMQRKSASPENAVRLQRVLSQIDVRELLPKVQAPTLIFHSRQAKNSSVNENDSGFSSSSIAAACFAFH